VRVRFNEEEEVTFYKNLQTRERKRRKTERERETGRLNTGERSKQDLVIRLVPSGLHNPDPSPGLWLRTN
jgi:hypothetical protein